jgi:hypothetical protein
VLAHAREKKRKLLFSFVSNAVKIRGFVEPAQRTCAYAPVLITDFAEFDRVSKAKSNQCYWFY